jgi:hypothetical protein
MERFNRLWMGAVSGAALTFGVSAQTVNQINRQQNRLSKQIYKDKHS